MEITDVTMESKLLEKAKELGNQDGFISLFVHKDLTYTQLQVLRERRAARASNEANGIHDYPTISQPGHMDCRRGGGAYPGRQDNDTVTTVQSTNANQAYQDGGNVVGVVTLPGSHTNRFLSQ